MEIFILSNITVQVGKKLYIFNFFYGFLCLPCEFSSYVDRYGETFVKIDCVVTEDEKEYVWDLMRFKHKKDCVMSSEPT